VTYYTTTTAPVPLGWQNQSFDDSAWSSASYVSGTFNPYNVGVKYSSYSTSGTSNGSDKLLVITHFNVPAGVFSVVLNITVKGNLTFWLNGSLVSSGTNPYSGELVAQVVPGDNVFAFQLTGNSGTSIRYAYQLNIQSCQNYTSPPFTVRRPLPESGEGRVDTTATATPTISPTATPNAASFALAAPNLSRNGEPIQFQVNLDQASTIHLILFDLTGEQVFAENVQGRPGENSLGWNLENQNGSQVASGLYVYAVSAQGGDQLKTARGKVAVLR
jgi:hypothetical protein